MKVLSITLSMFLTFYNFSQNQTKYNSEQLKNDRDKFIGKYSWAGECASGCWWTYTFKQNGNVQVHFQTARSAEDYSWQWAIDEKNKILTLGKDKWYYKFQNEKILITSLQFPGDKHEMSPEK